MAKYTKDEAIDIVLDMKRRCGTMPTKEDYEKLHWLADVNDLAEALDVLDDMKHLHVRAYAAVNIAVLRELRRRAGKTVFIAQVDESAWAHINARDFAPVIADA